MCGGQSYKGRRNISYGGWKIVQQCVRIKNIKLDVCLTVHHQLGKVI